MEFDLQRFAAPEPGGGIRGNTTKDGSIVEAFIYNTNLPHNPDCYDDIGTMICYTYGQLGYGDFILYKTQHKWGGGGYIVSKRICTYESVELY